MSILSVSKLSCSLSGKPVLQNVSFAAERQEFIGIAGLNGSGKTSLLKVLQRLIPPDHGEVLLHGKLLGAYTATEFARIVAVVPQRLAISFEYTARQMVLLGRTPYLSFLSRVSSRDEAIAEDAMHATDCWRFADFSVAALSAGELQRVCIATALAQQTEILLLDEPTSALDMRQQNRLLRLLASLQDDGKTILFATHDLTVLRQMANKVLLLNSGAQLAFDSPRAVLDSRMLRKIFEIEEAPLRARRIL